jgi:alkanesulfonate monooxygenase SsuD/methylene tetrahydromethanopterin reductase-like flavin-dependent oxidoreductase (luciferase family)
VVRGQVTDYGHDLIFGSFLTPGSQRPDEVAGLAQVSERAGLDLVTFQDHPYQPGFLDTWTLLSFVAARTSAVRLSANVLNLPLRLPAVVARSAASLDLLSGGRFELGLGAGAYWDAIEAMGGRRLSPAQAVQALSEAIDVIRGIWHTGEPGMLRVEGDFYRVIGAKRGPAPAHPIGIWLGAYKPRMLALTGRKADGWLPSLGFLRPGDLTRGNAAIDEAASEAGRDPADVRRLLNVGGGPEGGGSLAGRAEQLAGLALQEGISAFIIGSDDPAAIERFGREVAPAVRDLVAAERGGRGSPGRGTSGEVAPGQGGAGQEGSGQELFSQQGSGGGAQGPQGALATARAVASEPAAWVSKLGVAPTPDTGQRLSQVRLWDEAARPTAPPPPQDASYTARGRAIGSHLVDIHDHLRRELTQIQDLMDQVKAGALEAGQARSAINEMTMRQNDWTLGAYCASYCRVVTGHHTLEDEAVFPHLRASEAGLAPVIDRLADEHKVIHQVFSDVDAALVGLLRNPGDFSGLQRAADILSDTLLSHLAYEESQLIEPLARHGFYAGQV